MSFQCTQDLSDMLCSNSCILMTNMERMWLGFKIYILSADASLSGPIMVQLHTSLEQNDALQSERAALTTSLRKLEAFKQNLLQTLQASDVVVRHRLSHAYLI